MPHKRTRAIHNPSKQTPPQMRRNRHDSAWPTNGKDIRVKQVLSANSPIVVKGTVRTLGSQKATRRRVVADSMHSSTTDTDESRDGILREAARKVVGLSEWDTGKYEEDSGSRESESGSPTSGDAFSTKGISRMGLPTNPAGFKQQASSECEDARSRAGYTVKSTRRSPTLPSDSGGASKERRVYTVPTNPPVLPEKAKVSPLSSSITVRRCTPVSPIRNIGWDQLKGSDNGRSTQSSDHPYRNEGRSSNDDATGYVEKERNDSETTLFPSCDDYRLLLPSEQKAKTRKKPVYARSHPVGGSHGLSDFYRTAKQVYADGPKSDGKKLCRFIRRMRRQKKHADRRAHRQRQQLNTIYEKAYGPEPLIPAARSAPPQRPDPPSPLASTRPSRPAAERADEQDEQAQVSPPFSASSYSIVVRASPSVGYDAREVFVDLNKPLPRVPELDPAPRWRGDMEKVGTVKKGLPPPPVEPGLPPRSKAKAVPLVADERRQTAPVAIVVPDAVFPVGHVIPTTAWGEAAKAEAGLSDTWTGRPKAKKGFWSRLLDVPDEPAPWALADKHSARKQARLKAKISAPGPIVSPSGFSANIAAESGGVGGLAAAISLPLQQEVKEQGRKGKEKALHHGQVAHPPPPPPPPEQKKTHRSWREFTEGGKSLREAARTIGRRRVDSDTSFHCQGIGELDGQRYLSPLGTHSRRPQARAPPVQTQDRGPSTQAQIQADRYAFVDDDDDENDLILAPLFIGGGNTADRRGTGSLGAGGGTASLRSKIRNTRFYQPYDDVLHEYGS